MERARQRSLVVPPVSAKAPAPKLRKKLQKSVTRQRNNAPTRRPGSDVYNEVSSDNKSDTANKRTIAAQVQTQVQPQPCLPSLAPDLNDSKWSDYLLRETGCFCTTMETLPRPKEYIDAPVQIIPELSHLAMNGANPRTSASSSDSPDTSTVPTMNRRRRAKTPIFSIGQLEDIPRPGNALASEKRLSAEVIAEQYRALIASRNSIFKETHSEPSQSRQGHRNSDLIDEARQIHSEEGTSPTPSRIQGGQRANNLSPSELPNGSPTTSDDGTLVGFEEETVYFKPVSFSPEPMSPDFERRFRSPSPAQIQGNLSLQICLDLLTRDLSSGLRGAVLNRGDTSALQVWVMIEAYERLRDQLFAEGSSGRLGLGFEELGGVEMMMDMWLRALYSIHDGLVGGDGSDYGAELDLGMEELD